MTKILPDSPCSSVASAVAHAQFPPPERARVPGDAKAAAPIDLTGYWVSIVTEDWRYRMMTPRKGDYNSVPLTMAAKKAADAWDPAKDEASGEQCKSYGAPAIMRVPGRIHVTWQDDQTLKVEMDSGTQTRLFHFAGKPRLARRRGRAIRPHSGKWRVRSRSGRNSGSSDKAGRTPV